MRRMRTEVRSLPTRIAIFLFPLSKNGKKQYTTPKVLVGTAVKFKTAITSEWLRKSASRVLDISSLRAPGGKWIVPISGRSEDETLSSAGDETRFRKTLICPRSLSGTVLLVCLVATLSYLSARLGEVLALRPQMLWPLWPGCALLVAILLLVPRRLWPPLIAAGLAGFVLHDATTGLTLRPIILLFLCDLVEVLIAALGISYSFEGLPRLNTVKSLARYSFFAVFLAPISAAFLGAIAFRGSYWSRWRVSFLTEALALLTLTPAVLGLVELTGSRKSRAYYLEAAILIGGLLFCGYITLDSSGRGNLPVLLYTILPFLLWAALRFGTTGTSLSMIVVAFLSIWGAVHGRGPFTGFEPIENVWSLQLFLLLAATPFMVLAALVDEHKQALEALREGEERFRLVANSAPVMIWMSGPDRLRNYFNQPWLDFTGRAVEAELGNGWSQGVHADDLRACLETYTRAFDKRESFKREFRLLRHDGEYRWVFDIGVPRLNADGFFAGYIGSCIDITDKKIAEEALAGIGRRLLEAHEEERTWIARELHDDINQQIALLAVELEQLKRSLPKSAVGPRDHIRQVLERISQIGTDIQTLSRRLHSVQLEYLGIAAAARSHCKELSEQHQVEIDFSHTEVPRNVPKEVSLCLFRVLQESMRNAVRHSRAHHFKVHLRGTPEEIHLSVSDSGIGFDPVAAISGRGLGLISMRERVRCVNGDFWIESRAEQGTTIHARVPLSPRMKCAS
ncbi:MAG TPA: MASE1 domain-containing protein [Candidatus Cybelea sp.]|nr:MASE1 domain-containing protein [Candidatus Cybelea sp.]